MIFILAFMARAVLPHLLKLLLAEKAQGNTSTHSPTFFSFITEAAANHAQPNWLNNPVKLASRACLLSAACVHELLCGATFDRGPLCFVLKDTEEP